MNMIKSPLPEGIARQKWEVVGVEEEKYWGQRVFILFSSVTPETSKREKYQLDILSGNVSNCYFLGVRREKGK